ncbi:MAG: hypothetical protein CMG75_04590 [Candidatus Marinimicrobia bacterium]|nr:hypothetical protein [Candidatus Neomarinimicrobiota bacterium]
MLKLTEHEQKVFELIQQHPEILKDRFAREKIAAQNGMSEKTLRNRIGELRRFGLISKESIPTRNLEDDIRYKNILLIWSRRKLIIANVIIMGIITVIISLMMPKWYSSQAIILSSSAGRFNLMSAFANIPLNEFGFSPVNEDISSFISILQSHSVKEHMVKHFDLVDRYDSKDIEYAMEELNSNTDLRVTDEGALSISILDREPLVAQQMVQELLNQLDLINRRLSREQGKYNRQFLEERLNQTKIDLAKAEEELKLFQQQTGVVDILAQVTAQLETYGQLHSQELQAYTELYSQRAQTEVQLNTVKATLTPDNPTIRHYEVLYNEQDKQLDVLGERLDTELENLLFSSDAKGINFENQEKSTDGLWLSMSSFPDLGMRSVRLLREVEVQGRLLEIMVPQFEQARMEESKNIPTLQIIDEPRIPLNKTKPKRMFIVLAVVFMSTVFSVGYVFLEYHSRDLRKKLGSA